MNNDLEEITGNEAFQINDFCEFLVKQLKTKPEDRATARELLSHQLISEFTPLKENMVQAIITNDLSYVKTLTNIFDDFGKHGDAALREASFINNVVSVRHILVAFKGDKDDFIDRSNALNQAAWNNSIDSITAMLEFSNDRATLINKSGALIGAAFGGHIDVINHFVESGCDINFQRDDGWTALHAAVWFQGMEVVEYLLANKKIDVDRQDEGMSTPLHYAVERTNLALVKLLIEHGKARIDILDEEGKTPKQLAEYCLSELENGRGAPSYNKSGYKEVIAYLNEMENEAGLKISGHEQQ